MILKNRIKEKLLFVALTAGLLVIFSGKNSAQFENAWINAGDLHNWYSEIGCELEEAGFIRTQQDGLQYPAIQRFQDMQAMKGMWIGARNWTDPNGVTFPFFVQTVGPRNPAFFAYYPKRFEMVGKFDLPTVTVDGNTSIEKSVELDRIDPNMKWDRLLINEVNSMMGITMTRNISQMSQEYHDNYIVTEFIFKNTGNVDEDDEIELPNQTLEDVMFFFTYRLSVNKSTRFVIGNATGWGKNAMNDARGDGDVNPVTYGDLADENFRAQFTWHGYFPEKIVAYDNIGGPIWTVNSTAAAYLDVADTVGRLGASQFVGILTLHADSSPNDQTDDPTQPSQTFTTDSDSRLFLAGANALSPDENSQRYSFMMKGHVERHANRVVNSTNREDFITQTSDPALGGTGGQSICNAYGPYTLGPGDSVRIVLVEAADGMTYDDQVRIGRQFRDGDISVADKNAAVINTGRDSLFSTFRRAIAASAQDFDVPENPFPPSSFTVTSAGDRISLEWTPNAGDPNSVDGYRIYRARDRRDSTYTLIHEAGPAETSYDDLNPIRGFDYYYYITAYRNDPVGGAGTPPGDLESGRYFTQTYDPARLLRPPGNSMDEIRIVPNPFIISAARGTGRFVRDDQIAFYNIPGQCTIEIYTEIGELVKRIEHTNNSGDEFWYSVTESNQIVVSGIYIAVITNNLTGEKKIEKFAVIR